MRGFYEKTMSKIKNSNRVDFSLWRASPPKAFRFLKPFLLCVLLAVGGEVVQARELKPYWDVSDDNLDSYMKSLLFNYKVMDGDNKESEGTPNFFFLSGPKYSSNGTLNIDSLLRIFSGLDQSSFKQFEQMNTGCLILDVDLGRETRSLVVVNDATNPASFRDYKCTALAVLAFEGRRIENSKDQSLKDILRTLFNTLGSK